MKYLPGLILLIIALAACKEVYDRPPQSLPQINLYAHSTLKARTTRVTAQGYQNAGVWISNEDLSYFQLPLSDKSNQAVFVLLLDSIADTLVINYNSKLVYESMESGFYTEHYIQSVRSTANKIDSIALTDTLVITNWHENIQLYLNDHSNLSDN